jgi:N-acetylglutamate synthase-like GNAT family acetyltransferase
MNSQEIELAATLRLAGEKDVAQLATLVNRAYEVEQFFVDGARTTPEEVAELLRAGRFLVLDGPDGPAAAVYVKTEGDVAQIQMLSVTPELQGRGLGTRLVAVAEALSTAVGCRSMGLQIVNLRDELGTWYRSLGYRETSQHPYVDRPIKKPCHFIAMSKPLAAVLA